MSAVDGSAAFAAPHSSCQAVRASSRRPTRVCCVATGVPPHLCFKSVSGLCLSSAGRDRGVLAAAGPAPADHARQTSNGRAPPAAPAPAAAAAAAPAPRIPRSLAEVDYGQILGFAAELSEVSVWESGGAGAGPCTSSTAFITAHCSVTRRPPGLHALPCLAMPQDHPGFADPAYKQRRVDICNLARSHQM